MPTSPLCLAGSMISKIASMPFHRFQAKANPAIPRSGETHLLIRYVEDVSLTADNSRYIKSPRITRKTIAVANFLIPFSLIDVKRSFSRVLRASSTCSFDRPDSIKYSFTHSGDSPQMILRRASVRAFFISLPIAADEVRRLAVTSSRLVRVMLGFSSSLALDGGLPQQQSKFPRFFSGKSDRKERLSFCNAGNFPKSEAKRRGIQEFDQRSALPRKKIINTIQILSPRSRRWRRPIQLQLH
jgi:hypothetical protein